MTKRRPLESAEVECRRLGRALGERMPDGWGFALILFSFGDGGFLTYISNAQRVAMVAALRECADKIEKEESI